MLTVLLLAAAIAAGVHPGVVAIAAVAVIEPRLVAVGLVLWGIYSFARKGRSGDEPEADVLRAVGAELRGGATLRFAIADVAARSSLDLGAAGRLARAGMPMERIGAELRERMPHNGVPAAAALELSAWSGARAAAMFERLAERAAEVAELRREQRAATAQARLSAWVVGLAPLLFTTLLLAGGGAQALGRAGSAGYVVMAIGLGLEVAGLIAVALILRREMR